MGELRELRDEMRALRERKRKGDDLVEEWNSIAAVFAGFIAGFVALVATWERWDGLSNTSHFRYGAVFFGVSAVAVWVVSRPLDRQSDRGGRSWQSLEEPWRGEFHRLLRSHTRWSAGYLALATPGLVLMFLNSQLARALGITTPAALDVVPVVGLGVALAGVLYPVTVVASLVITLRLRACRRSEERATQHVAQRAEG